MSTSLRSLTWALLLAIMPLCGSAKEPLAYPMALFPFAERGTEVTNLGEKLTELLFANLSNERNLVLVEREELKKVCDELELNQSGLVAPDKAVQLGHLTGAKLLLTGSVIQLDKNIHLTVKIIGTETSRVLGASVRGNVRDDWDELAGDLSAQVSALLQKRAAELTANSSTRVDRITELQDELGRRRRPSVVINISELHAGRPSVDPAAETEFAWLCRELGFTVFDRSHLGRVRDAATGGAVVLISGEGQTEFVSRYGNLIAVKGRLEVKAIDRRSGQLLAIDRQTALVVGLTEPLSGKAALQEAAMNIALRILPKLADAAEDRNSNRDDRR